jgi:limonene 1,2-monooxygenase
MFGVGPGALTTDAYMMGIPVGSTRPRMDEALEVLIPLLRGQAVTADTDWFKLEHAQLQMRPWTQPSVEMAVAAMISPTGAAAAGRHGIGMLQFQALGKAAFSSLASNWAVCEQVAAEHGKTVDRRNWRLVVQVHLAETREQAIRDCRFGLGDYIDYYHTVAQLPIVPEDLTGDDLVQAYANLDVAVIGTPDDAIATIEKLQNQTGGFGCFMLLAHEWANRRATEESYELFARFVMPHFQQANDNREASRDWVIETRGELVPQRRQAIADRFAEHAEKYGTENLDPETLKTMMPPTAPK